MSREYYESACHKASIGKALEPNTIPNEIHKHLPESTNDLIFKLFQIMAKHSKKWCTSATKLVYKPNKSNPHNPSDYKSIVLMYCILKLWTFILTSIGPKRRRLKASSVTPPMASAHVETYTTVYPPI